MNVNTRNMCMNMNTPNICMNMNTFNICMNMGSSLGPFALRVSMPLPQGTMYPRALRSWEPEGSIPGPCAPGGLDSLPIACRRRVILCPYA